MKSIFTYTSLSVAILLGSCTSTVATSNAPSQLDQKIKKGKTYTFHQNDGNRTKIRVVKIDETHISGTDEEFQPHKLEKSKIGKVRKSNTLGTVLIVAGTLAALIVIPAYAKNEPVGGR